ncbi:50S ribosomal protein L29 [Candidatus Beckwithbacteria bacterium]|nr:50S ribosomal protein L29 [Candidatus Beckwithbacteria bacterium]
MKKDRKQTIREMSIGELSKRLTEITKELVDAKMSLAMGTLKNVHQIKLLRHEMAFIKTILTKRQQEAEPGK